MILNNYTCMTLRLIGLNSLVGCHGMRRARKFTIVPPMVDSCGPQE